VGRSSPSLPAYLLVVVCMWMQVPRHMHPENRSHCCHVRASLQAQCSSLALLHCSMYTVQFLEPALARPTPLTGCSAKCVGSRGLTLFAAVGGQRVAVRLMQDMANNTSPRKLYWATMPTKHQLLSEFNFPRSYLRLLQMPYAVRQ
jgi:hypothetical protein